jgi:hypothetical protein
MRSATYLLATLCTLGYAHSDPRDVHAGMPKIMGGSKFMANLKARNIFANSTPAVVSGWGKAKAERHLEARATNTCGPGVGSCDAGYCCSAAG